MNSIFLRTENSITNQSNVFRLNFRNKINLHNKLIALTSMTCYYTWKNITRKLNNGHYIIDVLKPRKRVSVDIPDGSYTVESLSAYFQYILEKNDLIKDAIVLIPNRTLNRITIKIKENYALELLTPETRKFIGTPHSRFHTGEYTATEIPQVEYVENVLVHCNLVYNNYQLDSELLYSFTPDASPGSLLHIHPNEFIFCNCKDSQFSYIEIKLTDQNENPIEIEDNVTFTLVIKDNFDYVRLKD